MASAACRSFPPCPAATDRKSAWPVAVRSDGDGCGWIAVTLVGYLSPTGNVWAGEGDGDGDGDGGSFVVPSLARPYWIRATAPGDGVTVKCRHCATGQAPPASVYYCTVFLSI
jgi:hypothetical protein